MLHGWGTALPDRESAVPWTRREVLWQEKIPVPVGQNLSKLIVFLKRELLNSN